MVTKLSDTFTDADGTDLTAHTMNVGSGWTAGSGTWQTVSNQAQPTAATDGLIVWADAGVSDVVASADLTPRTSGGNTVYPSLVFRLASSSDFWYAQLHVDSSQLTVYEVIGGSHTQRASHSASLSDGVATTMTVTLSGASVSAVAGGGTASYGSASSGLTATKFGFRQGTGGSPTTAAAYDNFLVTVPDVAPAFRGRSVRQAVKRASYF